MCTLYLNEANAFTKKDTNPKNANEIIALEITAQLPVFIFVDPIALNNECRLKWLRKITARKSNREKITCSEFEWTKKKWF